jgi:hypothetical protein
LRCHGGSKVQGYCGLARPALLVDHGNDHGLPFCL